MLGRDLQLSANVITHEILEKFFVFIENEVVKADARADKDLFDARNGTDLAEHTQIFGVINDEIFTRLGRKTFSALTHAAFFLSLAGGMAEVCGRTANVMDITLEIGHFGEEFCLFEDGFLASCGDLSALVICDRAEIARAVAATHVVNGEFYFFDRGNAAHGFIGGVIISFIRECINAVEFFLLQGEGRRILHDNLFAVALDDRFAAHSIVLILLNTAGARISEVTFGGLCLHFFKRLTFYGIGNIGIIARVYGISRAADIMHHGDVFAFVRRLAISTI